MLENKKIQEIITHIHKKELSIKEVVQYYLNRIKKINTSLNAIILQKDEKKIISEAEEKDKLKDKSKPLFGLPIAIKDLSDVVGIETTYGFPGYKNNFPKQNSFFVDLLIKNGAIIIGKTNSAELGVGGQLYVFENNKIVEDKINFIQVYDELVEVWNYELEFTHNYISNGILSHNAVTKPFTAGHRYFSSENLEKGDLVKLNENNEIVKTTEQKDTSVLGIVWYEFCLDSFSVDGEAAEKSDENIFRQ